MECWDCECPHCKHGIDLWSEDSFQDEESREIECPECEKTFIVTASYSVSYDSHCLNGEHKFVEMPTKAPYVQCQNCGKVTQHPEAYGDIDAIKRLIGERPDVCGCGCNREPKHGYQPVIKGLDANSGKEFTAAVGGIEVAKLWHHFRKRQDEGCKMWLHWD